MQRPVIVAVRHCIERKRKEQEDEHDKSLERETEPYREEAFMPHTCLQVLFQSIL